MSASHSASKTIPARPPTTLRESSSLKKTIPGSDGVDRSAGAVAELFDISCLDENAFDATTALAFEAWELASPSLTAQELIAALSFLGDIDVLGQHFFITNPLTGSGLSPKWDFTSASEKGHADAFVVGAKIGDLPAPSDPTVNIDWLQLNGVQGDLASQVYRIQTQGGQPPASVRPFSSHTWFL